jgi:hypothetical protein
MNLPSVWKLTLEELRSEFDRPFPTEYYAFNKKNAKEWMDYKNEVRGHFFSLEDDVKHPEKVEARRQKAAETERWWVAFRKAEEQADKEITLLQKLKNHEVSARGMGSIAEADAFAAKIKEIEACGVIRAKGE